MTGSTDDKSTNPGAVQGKPELTNEKEDTLDPTSDSPEKEVAPEASAPAVEEVAQETPAEKQEVPAAEASEVEETAPVETPSSETSTPVAESIAKAAPQNEEPTDATPKSDSTNEKDNKEEEENEEEEIDYTNYTKEQLTQALADLSNTEDGFKKVRTIGAIKRSYDEIFQAERAEALKRFEADGGSKDDFQYKLEECSIKFEAYYKILREKKSKNAKEHEKQKERNLELKNALLERLRVFVDDDENTSSINALKKMQEEWKAIGPVHHQHNRTLWANYNALMDRYYDHRSIYFELKELDRKKNLEAKEDLCKQAESLDALENLNEAIKRLNELHEEYKHIGPVPKEAQEDTWQRFKAASDQVYAKRKDYVSHLKEELSENYEKKIKIAERIAEYAKFTSDNIGEWNSKTKELLAIQKEWETVGAMPKDQAKAVNKRFWGDFKSFFHNKSLFFKTLDAQREENLKLKQALVEKAVELQNNENWEETASAYKTLQKDWKEIGPVPGKRT
ncbi:DUF349 domain-containing protein [Reichenbachiella carrageenanivorans]|uniref:DUF349 domain-containing protein n=1 Tax=Reichenbachiella carrageenanivorans TaxID=2979869 RepID=A0ABY6CWA0_9BACT|nr:DUF349 domain-containing protein [Reichenbachiella carrageenanivorans]UXX78194.1 DUF349 domain-containing protein [Reichenbachiella carrageenanivorans]